jgi:hypothetical protein
VKNFFILSFQKKQFTAPELNLLFFCKAKRNRLIFLQFYNNINKNIVNVLYVYINNHNHLLQIPIYFLLSQFKNRSIPAMCSRFFFL